MKYQALYRKYRPKNFNEVYGQKITLKILKNAIENNRIAHAYLFYGPRGTGKTSIAKILARTINCTNLQNATPCESCPSCLISKEKECVDIIEIDAASNNGVDEIRELKNKISFVPTELTYKVYIIDEVHMLSIGAFNALLKTLEEPPEHAVFILATTELNKVPSTIISRCQTLEFKKISNPEMKERLREIANNETINITDSAIEEIARHANGGLRDAIGLLEKSYAYSENQTIDENTIREISGNITKEEFETFIKIFEEKNIEKMIQKINDYYNEGFDLINLTYEIMEYIKNKIISEQNYSSNLCSIVKKLDNTAEQMKKSENPKIILEVTMMETLSKEPTKNNEHLRLETTELKEQDERKENKNSEEQKIEKSTEEEFQTRIQNIKKIRVGNTMSNPQKPIISEIRKEWDKLKDLAFDSNYGNLARLLSSDILPVAASETNVILISKMNGLAEQINNDLSSIEKIFELTFHKKYKPICITEKEWNENIEIYKKDKTYFQYTEEKIDYPKTKLTLREKARQLFE